ncbi:MAG: ABC-2 transporter permease [Oscillospiraceae bacterium]
MKTLLKKEFGLAGMVTYLYILVAFMAMIPNYPILVANMFVSIGMIINFQLAREAHDTAYFAILPVKKRDIVKAKFLFVMVIEGLSFLLSIMIVALRAIFLSDAQVYLENPMMNGNVAYLGYTLVCFAMFNGFFLAPFFKTGYSFVKPSIFFFTAEVICVGAFETLHHIFPELNATTVNSTQFTALAIGVLLYVYVTAISYRTSANAFERVDL